MMRSGALLGLALLALGCDAQRATQVCAPGSTQGCLCPGGTPGVQSCDSSGLSFGACQCTPPPDLALHDGARPDRARLDGWRFDGRQPDRGIGKPDLAPKLDAPTEKRCQPSGCKVDAAFTVTAKLVCR